MFVDGATVPSGNAGGKVAAITWYGGDSLGSILMPEFVTVECDAGVYAV